MQLVWPGHRSGLNRMIRRAIRRHPGPLFAMFSMEDQGVAEAALARYGLARLDAQCVAIASTLDQLRLRLCPLERDRPVPARAFRPGGGAGVGLQSLA